MSDAYPPNQRPNSVPPDLHDEDELPIHRGDPPRFRRNTFAAVALGAVALAAGGYAVTALWDRKPASRETRIDARREAAVATPGAEAVSWSPPDRAQVQRAYADAVRVYAAEGLSGLARQGQTCFATLNSAPSYAALDYCLALDAIGAEVQRRLSAGAAPDPQSWFGQSDPRGLNAARVVLAGQSDPSARLIDVRRMAQELVRQADARARATTAAATPVPAVPVPAPVTEPADASPTVTAEAPVPAAKAPPPVVKAAPKPTVLAQAPAVKAPATKAPAAKAPPPKSAPKPVVVAKAPAQKTPAPKAAPAPAPVREAAVRPSFNCRYARSPAEQMVCSNSRLADADQRLDSVFRRAMARAENPAALRRQQDRWLAARERAARLDGEQGVLEVYELRIDELREQF